MLDHIDVRDMINWQKRVQKDMNEKWGKKPKKTLILSCFWQEKIYDDNPRASNESRGAPLPWESFCWRMSLILAKWIIHTLFGHLCTPFPHTFIHLWQFYYKLAGVAGSGAKKECRMEMIQNADDLLSWAVFSSMYHMVIAILGILSYWT